MDPVVVVPAGTPLRELVGVGRRVVSLDERGRPTLLLPAPSQGTPDIASLPPTTLLSSVVIRLPDECVGELAPGDDS